MRVKKLLTYLAVILLILTACGDDDDGTRDPAGISDSDEWTTITDPLNGNTFRCFTIFRGAGSLAGGPAMFCYELDPTKYGG